MNAAATCAMQANCSCANYVRSLLLLWLVSLGACQSPETTTRSETQAATIASEDLWIDSRQTRIPATLVTPANASAATPLVLLLHGHGGTRHEAGGFTRVAQGLALAGISSIRMDFPGCGDSAEPFTENRLRNMLTDTRAARDAAMAATDIDSERIGVLGFSMGARVALLLSEQEGGYAALGLWAPAARNGAKTMQTYLGGASTYAKLRATAAEQGFAPFTTFWGQQQQLSLGWFQDLEQSRAADALQGFAGDLLVLYGDQDDVIPPHVARQVIERASAARSVSEAVIAGADHGLGLFTDDFGHSEQAVQTTIAFFHEKLSR